MTGTLVVGDVIQAGRDQSPLFDDNRHPDAVLLRALSRYQRELLARIIALDPSAAVAYEDTPLPLADFAAGITVPAYKYPSHVEVTTATEGLVRPVDLVSWTRHAAYLRAVYLRDGVLYLTGLAADWTGFSNIRFYYVPEPAALALVATSVLDYLPDAAEPTLVAYLASVMASRGGLPREGIALPDPAWHQAQWQETEERLLDEIGHRTQAVVSRVRDVFSSASPQA